MGDPLKRARYRLIYSNTPLNARETVPLINCNFCFFPEPGIRNPVSTKTHVNRNTAKMQCTVPVPY